jgi:signal transduction histidine kinase
MRRASTDDEFLEDADVSGVGLGLYLARNVMERMGGSISVQSEVGRGSQFELRLPLWSEGSCIERHIKESGNGKTVIGR